MFEALEEGYNWWYTTKQRHGNEDNKVGKHHILLFIFLS